MPKRPTIRPRTRVSGFSDRSGDGAVWAWGANGHGQLGNDTTDDSPVPVRVCVLNIGGATAVAGGDGFSLAILSDGTTQGWGLNDRYQLGTNDTVTTRTPVPVENQGVAGEPTTLFLGATAIAAGTFHGFAVTSSGRIYEWGIHPGPGNVCQGAFEQSKPQDRSVAQPGRFTLEVPPPPQLLPDIGLPEVVIAYRTVRGDQNAQGEYVKVKFSPSSFKLREGERGLSIVEAASLRNDNPYMFPFVLVSSSPARELEKPALVLGLPNCTAYYRPTAEQQLHWEIECLPSDTIAPLVNLYARAQKVLGSIVPNPAFTDAPVRPL